jgi:glutamate-ammonia-ligase adenylyltransferase
MGYVDSSSQTALAAFEADYREKTELNRKILDHLLHDAFGDDSQTEPEIDLVLDPEPAPGRIAEVLGRYGFRDVPQAYKNLMDLANEKLRFLSTRRCRHFLAAIAPRLLAAIAGTPDPDFTLLNLSHVSDSLGGKGVLWELFSFNPPTLHLYVELCSSSQYLASILISNPGMLDELLDSLLLDKLPTLEQLEATLADLCRGAEDIEPILHSFKNAQQLRVGVRDILGKEQIEATNGALSDIAEAILRRITTVEYEKLSAKLGEPYIGEPAAAEPNGGNGINTKGIAGNGAGSLAATARRKCELIVLAQGKFGARELNYYSDLDIVFLYEEDGVTAHARRSRRDVTTTNQHFFGELGQRIIKVGSQLGPHGKLFPIDPRLRPTGKSGSLATSLPEFSRYYAEGHGQLWERQALCKARVVFGNPTAGHAAMQAVNHAAFAHPWHTSDAAAVRQMRARVEDNAHAGNLKRGPGGLMDIEFLVQMLQLKHGDKDESVRVPGVPMALAALSAAGYLNRDDAQYFALSFRFLRRLQARLRLMSPTTRNELPAGNELHKLAKLLGYSTAEGLTTDFQHYTSENRRRFERLLASVT